jgi:hypothetical protein
MIEIWDRVRNLEGVKFDSVRQATQSLFDTLPLPPDSCGFSEVKRKKWDEKGILSNPEKPFFFPMWRSVNDLVSQMIHLMIYLIRTFDE